MKEKGWCNPNGVIFLIAYGTLYEFQLVLKDLESIDFKDELVKRFIPYLQTRVESFRSSGHIDQDEKRSLDKRISRLADRALQSNNK